MNEQLLLAAGVFAVTIATWFDDVHGGDEWADALTAWSRGPMDEPPPEVPCDYSSWKTAYGALVVVWRSARETS